MPLISAVVKRAVARYLKIKVLLRLSMHAEQRLVRSLVPLTDGGWNRVGRILMQCNRIESMRLSCNTAPDSSEDARMMRTVIGPCGNFQLRSFLRFVSVISLRRPL